MRYESFGSGLANLAACVDQVLSSCLLGLSPLGDTRSLEPNIQATRVTLIGTFTHSRGRLLAAGGGTLGQGVSAHVTGGYRKTAQSCLLTRSLSI